MTFHPLTDTIQKLLRDGGYWFETFEHEPVRTSEEAAAIRDGYTLHQGAKALIIRVKRSDTDKFFTMLVVPGDVKFDVTKVKTLYQAKDIRFATPPEIDQLTHGVLPGGIPPFGQLFGLEVIVDPQVLANDKIIFNAGDRAFSIGMKSADYLAVVKPRVETITQA